MNRTLLNHIHSRWDSSHSLDSRNDFETELTNVLEKRDRAWLKRWIKYPEQLQFNKALIVMQLIEQHSQLPLPSLQSSGIETEVQDGVMAMQYKETQQK